MIAQPQIPPDILVEYGKSFRRCAEGHASQIDMQFMATVETMATSVTDQCEAAPLMFRDQLTVAASSCSSVYDILISYSQKADACVPLGSLLAEEEARQIPCECHDLVIFETYGDGVRVAPPSGVTIRFEEGGEEKRTLFPGESTDLTLAFFEKCTCEVVLHEQQIILKLILPS